MIQVENTVDFLAWMILKITLSDEVALDREALVKVREWCIKASQGFPVTDQGNGDVHRRIGSERAAARRRAMNAKPDPKETENKRIAKAMRKEQYRKQYYEKMGWKYTPPTIKSWKELK